MSDPEQPYDPTILTMFEREIALWPRDQAVASGHQRLIEPRGARPR